MSVDLILRAPNRATLRTFAQNNGLMREVQNDDGTTRWELKRRVDWSPWNGSGKMMRTPQVDESTPATFVPGYVALLRITDPDDTPAPEDDTEETPLPRSKVFRYIRRNGTPGEAAGIPFYEIDGVQLFLRPDVETKLVEWGVPSHTYL